MQGMSGVFRRATRASSGAQLARLPARNRRVLGRATGASCDARPARLPTRTQRVLRRAVGTPLRRAKYCNLNGFVLTLVLLLCDLSSWATFALNHRLSAVIERAS